MELGRRLLVIYLSVATIIGTDTLSPANINSRALLSKRDHVHWPLGECEDFLQKKCGSEHKENIDKCNSCLQSHKKKIKKCCHSDCYKKGQGWCKKSPKPSPPPSPPPPPPPSPPWPSFSSQAALHGTIWGKYFLSLYGELPNTYPVDLQDFWCLYMDKMGSAGIHPPPSVGSCPTGANAPVGQRYDMNNAYSSKDLTWLWHPLTSTPPYNGFPSNAIVEVSHHKDPFGDEHHGMWFVYAKGSGYFLELGQTKIFNEHKDANSFFGASGNEDLCQKAAAKGYDSIQFIRHVDGTNYPCAQKIGASWMNMEIVAVKLIGTYACGQKQGTAAALRAGWNGDKPCKCDPNNANTNCVFSLGSSSSNGDVDLSVTV